MTLLYNVVEITYYVSKRRMIKRQWIKVTNKRKLIRDNTSFLLEINNKFAFKIIHKNMYIFFRL